VSKLGIYEIHPLADALPLLTGDEFDDLVEHIKTHGLKRPVVLSADGTTIIDGRNRYRACDALNIEPTYERVPEHLTDREIVDQYIVADNVVNRQLDTGPKAMFALAYVDYFAAEAKRHQGQRTDLCDDISPNRDESSPLSRQSTAKAPAPSRCRPAG